MQIVFDTASFISAMRSSRGAAAEIVRLILTRKIVILMDQKLGLEYRDVACRPDQLAASGRTRDAVFALVEALEAVCKPVEIVARVRPLSEDPNDDMVLDLAINGRADLIVTSNKRHFVRAAARYKIPVVTPGQFLVWMREGDHNVQ